MKKRMELTRRAMVVGLACTVLATALSIPGLALAAERPEEIMNSIYGNYTDDAKYAPPYTADLALVLADFEKHPGFDFFIDGQDYDKVSAEVTLASENDKAALVKVKATNFGKQRDIEVDFVRESDAWKIANVRYPGAEGFDLRSAVGLPAL